ncbi:MAG: glycosyltransferase family 2 protein [Lachnospiraceae bacterium]|nr:glycosyltransferase family 2 protein [Lachnospiraceae bacterium]
MIFNSHASVAVATYNGEKYIKEQLESILDDLRPGDEIVISDDCSSDATRSIIDEFAANSHEVIVKVLDGPGLGVKKNFENAIRNCSNEYIFLADQDDVWEADKVERVMQAFVKNKNAGVVMHDCRVTKEDINDVIAPSFFNYRGSRSGFVKNWIKNSYIGCCMAFKKELVPSIVPIPDDIEMHDQWIGMLAEIMGYGVVFLPEVLLNYRRHGDNASKMTHYPLKKMITNRITLYKRLKERATELKRG